MNQRITRRINNARQITNQRKSVERYNPTQNRIFYTGRTNAGVYITPDNVITVPAVWAAIRYLSESIAKMPWTVNTKVNGGIEEYPASRAHYIINKRASGEYSSYQFRETLMHWALRWGNGYAEIERDIAGGVLALWPIHPSRVTVYRDIDTNEIFYQVSLDSGRLINIDAKDMFHIRGFGESVVGVNVVAYAADSIGWAKATQLFGSGFFGNGANPSGIIKVKRTLNKTGLENIRKEFNSLYGGPNKGNSTAVLDAEMDYQALSVNPNNGQFIETNQFLIEEICRWFGTPPHKVYHLLRTSFNSIEHQSIEVVIDSLQPWERRFCDEADFKLLGQNRNNLFTDMDFSALLRGDSSARIAYYNGLRNMGAINVNEIRQKEGLPGIGPEGDLYLVQSQYTTLESILNPPEPEPVPVQEPVQEDPEAMSRYLLTNSLRNEGFLQ